MLKKVLFQAKDVSAIEKGLLVAVEASAKIAETPNVAVTNITAVKTDLFTGSLSPTEEIRVAIDIEGAEAAITALTAAGIPATPEELGPKVLLDTGFEEFPEGMSLSTIGWSLAGVGEVAVRAAAALAGAKGARMSEGATGVFRSFSEAKPSIRFGIKVRFGPGTQNGTVTFSAGSEASIAYNHSQFLPGKIALVRFGPLFVHDLGPAVDGKVYNFLCEIKSGSLNFLVDGTSAFSGTVGLGSSPVLLQLAKLANPPALVDFDDVKIEELP